MCTILYRLQTDDILLNIFFQNQSWFKLKTLFLHLHSYHTQFEDLWQNSLIHRWLRPPDSVANARIKQQALHLFPPKKPEQMWPWASLPCVPAMLSSSWELFICRALGGDWDECEQHLRSRGKLWVPPSPPRLSWGDHWCQIMSVTLSSRGCRHVSLPQDSDLGPLVLLLVASYRRCLDRASIVSSYYAYANVPLLTFSRYNVSL